MTTTDLIAIAAHHIAAQRTGVMQSSAELCLNDARRLQEKGDDSAARSRAIRSLSHTIGVFGLRLMEVA